MVTDNKENIDNDHTYEVLLEVKYLGRNKGNCGDDSEYGYIFFPHILSLREGDTKLRVTLSGSTPDCFQMTGIFSSGETGTMIPDRYNSMSLDMKYVVTAKCDLTVNIIDKSRNDKRFKCDPQVQNSPPP